MLYDITIKSPPRKAIADFFGIKDVVLVSWLHTLAYVRNICAHHARLWNKDLRIPVKVPKKTTNKWLSGQNHNNRKMYIILAIIAYLLDIITPHNSFRKKVRGLMAKYDTVDITAMGFPDDWLSDTFW